ncbi:formyltransferase family protein [Maridesulfovibrio zosterae]|uniref:formyltransferase family protein n=1 Tax=Maridesulfovibrio zosterae TaxID=82171 RepID=UPI0004139BF2|nr:formyltransferase family protein [Maridesulfovibrio zosterae]
MTVDSGLKKVFFMGCKQVATECFQLLLNLHISGKVIIVGALSSPHKLDGADNVTSLCAEYKIPILSSLESFLDFKEVDILISVQFGEILKRVHLEKAREINVNLHMAPLPEYRGCNQFSHALLDGKDYFGTTLHVIDEQIDHGDILFEKRFPIPEGAWVEELYSLTVSESVSLFRESIKDLIVGKYTRTPQAELLDKRGTSLHLRREMEMLKLIDLTKGTEHIYSILRATSMPGFPPPFAELNGEKVYLVAERYALSPHRLLCCPDNNLS